MSFLRNVKASHLRKRRSDYFNRKAFDALFQDKFPEKRSNETDEHYELRLSRHKELRGVFYGVQNHSLTTSRYGSFDDFNDNLKITLITGGQYP